MVFSFIPDSVSAAFAQRTIPKGFGALFASFTPHPVPVQCPPLSQRTALQGAPVCAFASGLDKVDKPKIRKTLKTGTEPIRLKPADSRLGNKLGPVFPEFLLAWREKRNPKLDLTEFKMFIINGRLLECISGFSVQLFIQFCEL